MKNVISPVGVALTLLVGACTTISQTGTPIQNGQQVPYAYNDAIELEQGWTDDTQDDFYFRSQGSQIFPYAWFLALEQKGSQALFRSNDNMDRLRYLPAKPSKMNPDGLPVGWTKDTDQNNKEWIGLTCAACHTGQIEYTNPTSGKTTPIRIEGAPTLADFEQMNLELVQAMQETASNANKFDRFAKAILKTGDSPNSREALKKELLMHTEELDTMNKLNHSDVRYGYSRLDAVGAIFNKVTVTFLDIPSNQRDSDAPVSYPFLWGTPQSDVVQWPAFAPNASSQLPKALSALPTLIRNGGEVLGVYGRMGSDGVASIQVTNIAVLERWLQDLRSPQWPAQVFPPIDSAKASQGKPLYAKYCAECHQVIPRAKEGKPYRSVFTLQSKIKTDNKELANILLPRQAGPFEGRLEKVESGPVIQKETTGLPILSNTVTKSLLSNLLKIAESSAFSDFQAFDPPDPVGGLGYKARPLNGIWATAPYLHNGSVPNLYELLLPVEKRSKMFQLGSREYDPVRVGYVTQQAETATFKPFTLDTSLPGNRNTGHTYGSHLSDADKWAIVEYMKTL